MAEIRRFPFVRHLRSDPTAYVLRYRAGRLVQSGAGLAFWFRPLRTSLVEVPVDDRELQLHLQGRSADFQDIAVQAALTFRVAIPGRSPAGSTSRSIRSGVATCEPRSSSLPAS